MKNKIKKFLGKGNICNQDNRKNAGITLVALVITVIILLILAGISIGQLTRSGLFEKAKEARDRYKNAQNEEEIQIAKYSNEIDSYVGGGRNPLPSQILYPNNPNTEAVGTAQNPDIISAGNRIEIDNPYPGHYLNLIVQVKYNDLWCETGWAYTSAGGYGVKATQLQGTNTDKIIIQAGGTSLFAYSADGGSGFGINAYNYPASGTTAPFRLIAICLD